MTIWQFQRLLTSRLLAWSVASVLVGGVMALARGGFWRGVGAQFAGWGLVDGLIAVIGQRSADGRQDTADPAVERTRLRRLLWINAGLDILYMLGGRSLTRRESQRWRGHGWGIIVQGGFLFLFDVVHAILVDKRPSASG